jgi:hypothetical protein
MASFTSSTPFSCRKSGASAKRLGAGLQRLAPFSLQAFENALDNGVSKLGDAFQLALDAAPVWLA